MPKHHSATGFYAELHSSDRYEQTIHQVLSCHDQFI